MTEHKHHDLIVAWAGGAEIECRMVADPCHLIQAGLWLAAGTPSWITDGSVEYRVKPPAPDPHAELRRLYEAGAMIQVWNGSAHAWHGISDPQFYPTGRYRVKPDTPATPVPPSYLIGQRVLVHDTEIGTVTFLFPGQTDVPGCMWVRPASKDYSLCYALSSIKPLPGGQL